jgi:hypothetical protein
MISTNPRSGGIDGESGHGSVENTRGNAAEKSKTEIASS